MDIHNYHPITGELLCIGLADDNPLEPSEPIVPGYATPTTPPAAAERRARLYLDSNGRPPQNWPYGAWTVVPDFRAEPLFRTADGSPFSLGQEYTGLGELPPFLTTQARPSAAHAWVSGKWQLDKAKARELRLAAGQAERAQRIEQAREAMEPLQFAVELGEATTAESARLTAWKRYMVALNRLDLATPDIAWPEAPAA